MKLRIELVFAMVFAILLSSSTIALKIVMELSWVESLQFVYDILLSKELISLEGLNFGEKVVVFFISILSAAIQLGMIVFFVNLVIQFIIRRQESLEDKISTFIAEYPIRRVFTIVFLSVLFFSIVVIRTIERISWLDAIYFTIITISTVGFGDISPNHPISRVVTILLIMNGITFIGLASQLIIDRIVNLQLSRQNSLPSSPLQLKNHIIIGGFGSKGRRLAQLFVERGYVVVVVEKDEDRAKLAEFNELTVINGDITKPALLEILSLSDSAGLFLLLTDDNLVIQTGIIARSIAPDLDIYGEFVSVPTYNIARYAGINKPISLSVFLTNELQSYFTDQEIQLLINLKDLRSQESSLGFIQIPIDFDYEGLFDNPLVIGEVATGLNEIYLDAHLSINYERPPIHSSHLLIAIDKEELDQKMKFDQKESVNIERLIFAGYSDLVESLIERLDFPPENIVILWNKPEYQELLQQKNYKKYQWSLENGHLLLQQLLKDGDLVICSFDDITSSLIVGVTVNNLRTEIADDREQQLKDAQLIQLVPYEYDIEPLMKVGAEVVFTPQQIISSAILSIFLKENNLSPSVIYTNGHLYEHLTTPDDFFEQKAVADLRKEGYNILYVREGASETFTRPDKSFRLNSGDRALMFIKNKQKERLDRFL